MSFEKDNKNRRLSLNFRCFQFIISVSGEIYGKV